MTDTPTDYDAWFNGYLARGLELEKVIMATLQEAMAEASAEDAEPYALPNLRRRRVSFEKKFCLFLHPTSFDGQLLRDGNEKEGVSLSDAAVNDAGRMSQENMSEALDVLMRVLDETCGVHIVMIERENEQADVGPVRLNAPDSIWLAVMGQLAELAHVIVAVGGSSNGLIEEVGYVAAAGLRDRMLLYSKGRLLDGEVNDKPTIWTPDKFGEAIDIAAASQPDVGSEARIAYPISLYPDWFVAAMEADDTND